MKLLRFGEPGIEKPGILIGDFILDLSASHKEIAEFDCEWISSCDLNMLASLIKKPFKKNLIPVDSVRIGPPIKDPSKIICLGINYADHAAEGKRQAPKSPILFCKSPTSINGPYDPIIIPYQDAKTDWEVELAVVIGKKAKAVSQENAMDVIFGYTIMNDISGREAQFGDGQWFRGKSFDTFAPLGPYIATKDEIPNPHNLNLYSKVNGKLQQSGNTQNLIFNIPFLIEFISQGITLLPGDIISTGTPAGVGVFKNPPLFLKNNDVVEVGIECLGTQKNIVR